MIILFADMDQCTQETSIEIAIQAVEQFKFEKDIAHFVKTEFDKKFSSKCHVIVGQNFGTSI